MFKNYTFLLSISLLLFALGCDEGSRRNSFVNDANTSPANPVIGTIPTPGGGGGGGGGGVPCTASFTFAPTSPLAVNAGDPDDVITVTGTPTGGTISLTNIVLGGTNGDFILGPGANDFTFTTSTADTTGTATVDVIYDASGVDPTCTAVTQTYTVNVTAVAPPTLSFDSGGPLGIAITDSPGPAGTPGVPPAVSTIDTSAGPGTTTSITDVRVYVDIAHPFRADVLIVVTSPSSTPVSLIAPPGVGGGSDDIRVIFDDAAGAAIATYTTAVAVPSTAFPAFPSFTPSSPLSAFDAEDANGVWTLTVADDSSILVGTLDFWGLAFNGDTSIF